MNFVKAHLMIARYAIARFNFAQLLSQPLLLVQ